MLNKSREYRLSPLAENDLEDIWLYSYQNWSGKQANTYHREIMAAVKDLANSVKKGRKVEIRKGYLKYAVGSHLVFYRQSDTNLDIIRILHQQMDANRHL